MMEYGSQARIPSHLLDDAEYRHSTERDLQIALLMEMREHLFEGGSHTISILREEEEGVGPSGGDVIIIYRAKLETRGQ
jgi:hypothetical protein